MEKKDFWISPDNYKKYRSQMASYAIANRLSNYGYSKLDFRKMQNQKQVGNAIAKRMIGNIGTTEKLQFSKEYHGIYSRFYIPKEAKTHALHYCTGQSQNEEMITVLECLTGTYRKDDFIN